MLNIILILLLAHLIGNVLFGNPYSTILSCGLYGFVADSPKKFSWDKFNILGSFNDSRGGDSCGRTHGNIAEWGVNLLSKYGDYVKEMKNSPMNSNVIIGHSRKASSGGRDDKYAQPIIFKSDSDIFKEKYATAPRKYKKWANEMAREYGDEPFIAFAGAHNGTLSNEEDLAKKYKIDSTDKNDTMILMEIIFKHGYNVLEEYIGGAALLIHDAFSPESLIVFKGHSPNHRNSTFDSEERPLYYWQKSDNTIYLSSLESPLNFIGGNNKDIKEIPENVVFKITNGIMVQEKQINRDDAGQRESIIKSSNYSRDWNDRHYGGGHCGYHHQSGPIKQTNKYSNLPDHTPVQTSLLINEKRTYPDNYKIFGSVTQVKFENEIPPDLFMDRIYYCKGRYWAYHTLKKVKDPNLVNGVYHVDFVGTVYDSTLKRGNIYYFLDGMLLRGPKSYKTAKALLEKNANKSEATRLSAKTLTKRMAAFVALPIHTMGMLDQDITEPSISGNITTSSYTGSIKPPFSRRIYYVDKGGLIGAEESPRHNGITLEISEEDSYEDISGEIKLTPAIKEFFTDNYAFCGSCLTKECENCVVMSKFEGTGNKVPNIGGEYLLDLSGKTGEEIIRANSNYYFSNYDFCDNCSNMDCGSCIVVDTGGTTIPRYKRLPLDKDKIIHLSEEEAWKAAEAAKDEYELDNKYDKALLEGSENSGHRISAEDFSDADIAAGDAIAKASLDNIIRGIDSSLYEIEEEVASMDRDSVTKDLTKIIDTFKDDLHTLKIELL